MAYARDSRRENVVRDAARFLGEQLERVARERGEYFSPQVEPRGDYYISESDPTSRGKVIRIRLPGRDENDRPLFFDGFISLGEDGWEGSYQAFAHYGRTVANFGGTKTSSSVNPATSFVVRAYQKAWDTLGTSRDPAQRRRIRPTRAEQQWISEKIRILREEGYGGPQAAAIAYRMVADRRKKARTRTRRRIRSRAHR